MDEVALVGLLLTADISGFGRAGEWMGHGCGLRKGQVGSGKIAGVMPVAKMLDGYQEAGLFSGCRVSSWK